MSATENAPAPVRRTPSYASPSLPKGAPYTGIPEPEGARSVSYATSVPVPVLAPTTTAPKPPAAVYAPPAAPADEHGEPVGERRDYAAPAGTGYPAQSSPVAAPVTQYPAEYPGTPAAAQTTSPPQGIVSGAVSHKFTLGQQRSKTAWVKALIGLCLSYFLGWVIPFIGAASIVLGILGLRGANDAEESGANVRLPRVIGWVSIVGGALQFVGSALLLLALISTGAYSA